MPGNPDADLIIGVTPAARPDGRVVVGLARAGALGVLDVGSDPERAASELALVVERTAEPFGVRLQPDSAIDPHELPTTVTTVVVAALFDASDRDAARNAVAVHTSAGRRVLAEVTSLDAALAAIDAGAHGLIAKGSEAGGVIGDEPAFVLLQHVLPAVDVPVWLQGGIGLHTAAAAIAGGARGVVLDVQLALARESTLPAPVRAAIGQMDGSETREVAGLRVYTRPDLPAPDPADGHAALRARFGGDDLASQLLPVGQDGAFAGSLAERYVTVGGIVGAIRSAVAGHIALARAVPPLAPGAGVAAARGIEYPIAQGPMTRVSDRPAFAAAVADAGGLPFLALALMHADEVRTLLAEAHERLGDRPWGVGILGFVPPELREEQLGVLREMPPPVALIAGGRPSQAAPLEAEGVVTYLHVPSPGLLDRFLKDGARRFVFEGRECGGHVGPRSSFALWELQIERLLAHGDDLTDVEVLFAGGVHDARSAAMVAALAAPLAERGARVGVLMGSAYVLTHEAVAAGAITPTFQAEALACGHTVLLETSPGHATRCVDSAYVSTFTAERERLEAAATPVKEMWAELEDLNLGRLRIASKGLLREGDVLVDVDAEGQRRDGMFMIGQVAALRDRTVPIADLHADVSEGAARHLASLESLPAQPASPRREPLDIAIIGTAGLFAGAADVEAFWANVVAGVDSITEVPADRWSIERYYDPEGDGRGIPSKWGGFLPAVAFDPMRWGIPPTSVRAIGQDQLLALEVAAAALADAGYATRPFDRKRTAVIFGAESGTDLANAYSFRAALPHFVGNVPPELDAVLPEMTEDSFPGVLANVVAGRIANRLNLGGTNYTVDAACGASMAALATACNELATGACDFVLCGGVDLHNGPYDYLLFASVHALSRTGRCKTFDNSADGISLGEGVGCVALKRLADAERDGDRILAVIEGVGASSDGRSLGLTAPRTEGQQLAVQRAYEQAGISPATVGLVEAHGTGTVVGDRTELGTLTELFSAGGASTGSVVVGSIKSQIGHTKCAAGIAGLIKAVHSVHRGVLPPTLHVHNPNEGYDAATSPFVFNDVARPWIGGQRRAAVSAFGFGGTNFHAVLSSYDGDDELAHALDEWPAELVLLRGASAEEGRANATAVLELVDVNDAAARPWTLRDIARTAATRSERAPIWAAIVANDLDDLRTRLTELIDGDSSNAAVFTSQPSTTDKIAFLFPGQGSQRPHMLGDLFIAFPRLRRYLELGDPAWVAAMFPPAAFGDDRRRLSEAITDTRIAQPALGMASLAMHDLLTSCGVHADLAGGHSYGELAALATAGAFDERDLLALSGARGEAILSAAGDDPGAMAAVRASADDVRAALRDRSTVVVANDNAPNQCVISGPTSEVDAAVEDLSAAGHNATRINVACAFHTPGLAAARDDLAKRLADIAVSTPTRDVYANTTAARYPQHPDDIRSLLAEQVVAPVAFRDEIEAMYDAGARTFVEVGPGRVLTQLVGKILKDRPHAAIATDVAGEPGIRRFLFALGELAARGVDVDVSPLFEGRGARVVDAKSVPKAPPYWLHGQVIRTHDGTRLPGSMLSATELKPLAVGANGAAPGAAMANGNGDAAHQMVSEYLRSLRELVAAERDVMLTYLGGTPNGHAAPARDNGANAVIDTQAVTPSSNGDSTPDAAAVAAPSSPETGPRAALSRDDLLAAVIGIVSERTGYPTEMLDPDLDLEAELSIDSIKRIEIIGELADRIGLPGMGDGGVDEAVVEELALVKTLRGIVEWIEQHGDAEPGGDAGNAGAEAVTETDRADSEATTNGSSDPRVETMPPAHAQRYVPRLVEDAGGPASSLEGHRYVVVDDGIGVAEVVHEQLVAHGAEAEVVSPQMSEHSDGAGLIDLSLVGGNDDTELLASFERLRSAALGSSPVAIAVSALGGAFGLDKGDGRTPDASFVAGVQAMVRTLGRESHATMVRNIDLDRGIGPNEMARLVVAELAELVGGGGTVDVGYPGGRRAVLRWEQATLTADGELERDGERPLRDAGLDADSVVVVTGGARGIGARVAIGLAQRFGCAIEVVGRTPAPDPDDTEPPHVADASDAVALRKALIAAGELTRPQEIEAEVARISARREVRANLDALATHSRAVRYHAVDVRDDAAVTALVTGIRERHGRIDALLHAAGVRDDKLMRDKTPESFANVVGTKTATLRQLVDALDEDGLAVLFASVSGAFGNAGQVDYAAANAILDGFAHSRATANDAGPRIVSIDWGPWAGTGMVTAELAREYERRGIGLVDPDEGVAAVIAEIAHGLPEPQVVVMRASPEQFRPEAADAQVREVATHAPAMVSP